MKKKTMRIVSMLACLMVIATSGVACGGRREDGTNGDEQLNKPVDVNKTQFAIANANAIPDASMVKTLVIFSFL